MIVYSDVLHRWFLAVRVEAFDGCAERGILPMSDPVKSSFFTKFKIKLEIPIYLVQS